MQLSVSKSKSENIYVFGNNWGLYVDLDIENPTNNKPHKMNERTFLKHSYQVYLDKYNLRNVEHDYNDYNEYDCSFLNYIFKTLIIVLFIYLLKIFVLPFAE